MEKTTPKAEKVTPKHKDAAEQNPIREINYYHRPSVTLNKKRNSLALIRARRTLKHTILKLRLFIGKKQPRKSYGCS